MSASYLTFPSEREREKRQRCHLNFCWIRPEKKNKQEFENLFTLLIRCIYMMWISYLPLNCINPYAEQLTYVHQRMIIGITFSCQNIPPNQVENVCMWYETAFVFRANGNTKWAWKSNGSLCNRDIFVITSDHPIYRFKNVDCLMLFRIYCLPHPKKNFSLSISGVLMCASVWRRVPFRAFNWFNTAKNSESHQVKLKQNRLSDVHSTLNCSVVVDAVIVFFVFIFRSLRFLFYFFFQCDAGVFCVAG